MGTSLYDIYGPGLYIDDAPGDIGFLSQVRASLNCLRSREAGVTLLKAITDACSGGKHDVVIEKSETANAIPTLDTSEAFRLQLRQPGNGLLVDDAYKLVIRGKGGCSAIARWNPSNTIPGTKIERPSYLSLAHELVHCLHFIVGDCARAPTREFDLKKDSGLAEEEARTVGIAAYDYPSKYKGLCENMFREQFGQPCRTEYAPGITLTEARRT